MIDIDGEVCDEIKKHRQNEWLHSGIGTVSNYRSINDIIYGMLRDVK